MNKLNNGIHNRPEEVVEESKQPDRMVHGLAVGRTAGLLYPDSVFQFVSTYIRPCPAVPTLLFFQQGNHAITNQKSLQVPPTNKAVWSDFSSSIQTDFSSYTLSCTCLYGPLNIMAGQQYTIKSTKVG